MRVVPIEEFHDKGWRWAAEEARRVTGSGSAYLSLDIDSLDPVYVPGTGTPEPGGLTTLRVERDRPDQPRTPLACVRSAEKAPTRPQGNFRRESDN
jgi:Arginase family